MARAAVLFEVSLVVLFGRPETRRGKNLRDDRTTVIALLAIARRFGEPLLFLAMREDGRAVLIADVGALTIELRRIVNLPESVSRSS